MKIKLQDYSLISNEYKEWLERMIEQCLEDKDLQREHWAFCQAYKKLKLIPAEKLAKVSLTEGIICATDYIIRDKAALIQDFLTSEIEIE